MKRILCLLVCLVLAIPAFAFAQEDEPLYPACFGDLWGYINARGETVLEPQWKHASIFRNGYAIVSTTDDAEAENGNVYNEGIIDRTGAYVVEPHYGADTGYDGSFYGGRETGVIWMSDENYGMGFFNVPTGYFSGIIYDGEVSLWINDNENLIPYAKDGLYGVIDRSNGSIVIPCQYEYEVSSFSYGYGCVNTNDDGDEYMLINADNVAYVPPAGVVLDAREFSCGLIEVKDSATGLYGFADTTGALVIPATFDEVKPFAEDFACVRKGDLWGHIGKDGAIIVEPCYDSPYTYCNGVAVVNETTGRSTVLDKTGAVLFTMEDANIGRYSLSGVAMYSTAENRDELAKVGFIDTAGRVILTPDSGLEFSFDYGDDFLDIFPDGYQMMLRGDLCGFIDMDGKTAVEFIWTNGYNFRNGLAWVYDANGVMAYIDHTGAIVWRQP